MCFSGADQCRQVYGPDVRIEASGNVIAPIRWPAWLPQAAAIGPDPTCETTNLWNRKREHLALGNRAVEFQMSYGWSQRANYCAVEFPVLMSVVGTESGTVLGMTGQDDPRGETCPLEKRSGGCENGLQHRSPHHTPYLLVVPIFAAWLLVIGDLGPSFLATIGGNLATNGPTATIRCPAAGDFCAQLPSRNTA